LKLKNKGMSARMDEVKKKLAERLFTSLKSSVVVRISGAKSQKM